MREYRVPATVAVGTDENLTDMVWANAERFGDGVIFRRKVDGSWVDVTSKDFQAQVIAVAKGLVAAGVEQGDRVAILSKTRYEWTLVDFAVWAAGGVVVPIYETSSAEQVEWVLSDSGARAIVVENAAHRATVDSVVSKLPELQHIWQFEGPSQAGAPGAVDELTALGASVDEQALTARRGALKADTLATLIYTSGTTGRPKGCELTHGNLLWEVRAVELVLDKHMNANSSVLMFLPLAHVFARVIVIGSVYNRVVLGHTADVSNLLEDLAAFRPAFLLSVPRVFEKVYNGAKQKAHAGGKGKIFDAAEATAVAYSEALDKGGPGLALRLKHAVFDKLVYGKLRAAMGNRCEAALSGGAPLGARLSHFFRGVGVIVYEGYGLTETSAGVTLNNPDHLKIGTVGRPVDGSTVGIAEDGEILIKSPVVFRGYWKNEKATAEALTDGWFHTGDLGALDEDGYLSITGRKKEIIVTAGGKNVAPAVLEDRLRSHPLISQCMVVGDKQPFIAALVTIDPEYLPSWAEQHGKSADTPMAELVNDPQLLAEVQGAVDEANKAVSKAEAIKKFRVLNNDFTEQTGELTASMKLRRGVVAKSYAQDIAALYA
ncbi:long-chain fatty acid--CoA ligase [Pseudonocardiaceae bacterium YIM PH 21723]|nr:long-chain fatty acid--CoA ligase [Pseudonocardiaceae bacterium YIM PH 21723]